MKSNLLNNLNINGSGGVVASPDTDNGSGGSYYFDWMRDASLTMRAYMFINDFNVTAVDTYMQSYV